MSNLTEHAELELKLAGLHEPDADYEGAIYTAVMELVEVFSKQGHSGFSASMVLDIFNKVASFKNLEPIGTTQDEWVEVSEGLWQNKRNSELFSKDGGKTWYNVNDI